MSEVTQLLFSIIVFVMSVTLTVVSVTCTVMFITCIVMSIIHIVVSATQMFVLALKRATYVQCVVAEHSFSLVADPVHCLYEIARSAT